MAKEAQTVILLPYGCVVGGLTRVVSAKQLLLTITFGGFSSLKCSIQESIM